MNRTPSGSIAVGAPLSFARINEECKHAMENSYHLLSLTDEGQLVLKFFARTMGCDYPMMLEYEKENTGSIATWITKEEEKLRIFMRGLITGFNCM